ncbi:MAG TPA: hypothetical protein DCZ72_07750 [Armatimonadetes bacterium]|nr:hypothetical protein [Armatimonadota bacterium]
MGCTGLRQQGAHRPRPEPEQPGDGRLRCDPQRDPHRTAQRRAQQRPRGDGHRRLRPVRPDAHRPAGLS